MTSDRSRWLGRIRLAALSVLATLLVAEVAARIWLDRAADDEAFRAYASVAQLRSRLEAEGQSISSVAPHRYMGFVPSANYQLAKNQHNALGFRGGPIPQPKPEGEFRIVCLGGSTTYSVGVDDWRASYPARLEAELRKRGYSHVRVVNGGASGWSSFDTLANLQYRVLDLDPDLVIVYHALNDMASRLVWPPEAYRGDNSGAVQPASLLGDEAPLIERSTLARIVLVRAGWARSHIGLFRNFSFNPPTARYWPFVQQVVQGRYPAGFFAHVSAAQMLDRNPPIYFRSNLESIVAIARSRGIQPVLTTFELLETADDPTLTAPDVLRTVREHNAVVVGLARELDVPLFPFAERFPDAKRFFVGAIHFTAAGNRMRARLFADFLTEQDLVPAAGPPMG